MNDRGMVLGHQFNVLGSHVNTMSGHEVVQNAQTSKVLELWMTIGTEYSNGRALLLRKVTRHTLVVGNTIVQLIRRLLDMSVHEDVHQ